MAQSNFRVGAGLFIDLDQLHITYILWGIEESSSGTSEKSGKYHSCQMIRYRFYLPSTGRTLWDILAVAV